MRVISLIAALLVVVGLGAWVALLWAGWTVLFLGGHPSLRDVSVGGPLVPLDYVYYVGYTIFTLGNGGFVPIGEGWQSATALAAGSGMLLITLSITYVLSILRAVNGKRSFAQGVTGLGSSSTALVRTGWNAENENFRDLHVPFTELSSQLDRITQQHLSYPILHYYRSKWASSATPVAAAILAETMLVLRYGVRAEYRPNETLRRNVESSLESYLTVLDDSGVVAPADETPPAPDLEPLRRAGVPTVSDDEFAERLAEHEEYRRELASVVAQSEWDWPAAERSEP